MYTSSTHLRRATYCSSLVPHSVNRTNRLSHEKRCLAYVRRQHVSILRTKPLPFPIIPTCPEPTCTCTPMPAGLDIERSNNLNGTMVPYSQHVLICTGQSDWKSKIEDEKDTAPWGDFTHVLKSAVGPKGRFHDVCSSSRLFDRDG